MSCDSYFTANIINSRYDDYTKFSIGGNNAMQGYLSEGWTDIANNDDVRNERGTYSIYSYDTLLNTDFLTYEDAMYSIVILQKQKKNSTKWQCLCLYRKIENYKAGQVWGKDIIYTVNKRLDQKNDPYNPELASMLVFPDTSQFTKLGSCRDIYAAYNQNKDTKWRLMDPLNIMFGYNYGEVPRNCWKSELDKYNEQVPPRTFASNNGCDTQFKKLTGVELAGAEDNAFLLYNAKSQPNYAYYKSTRPITDTINWADDDDIPIDPNSTDSNIQDPTNDPNQDPETAPINNGTTIGDLDKPPHHSNPPQQGGNNTNNNTNNGVNNGMSGTINFTPGTYTSDENAIDSINDYDSETSPVNTAPIIPSNNTKKNDSFCDSCEKGETCKDTKVKLERTFNNLVLLLGLGALLIYTASSNK